MAHSTKPDQAPPPPQRITFVQLGDFALWCGFTADEDGADLRTVFVNGAWLDALKFFEPERFDQWLHALNNSMTSDAEALAGEVLETLPAFDGALARAAMRNQEWR